MSNIHYPAIFRPVGRRGQYSVDFPDLPGCISAGDTLEESVRMAREALSLHLSGMQKDQETIPVPSDPTTIHVAKGEFVRIIETHPDIDQTS